MIIIGKIIIIVHNQANVDLYFRQVHCCTVFYTKNVYSHTVTKHEGIFSTDVSPHKNKKEIISGYQNNIEAHV